MFLILIVLRIFKAILRICFVSVKRHILVKNDSEIPQCIAGGRIMLSRVNAWIDAMFLFNNQIFFFCNLEVKMTDVRCTCGLKSLCMSPGFRDKYYKVISISNISTAFSNSITVWCQKYWSQQRTLWSHVANFCLWGSESLHLSH